MSLLQRAVVILVVFSTLFLLFGGTPTVKSQSSGDMNCSFFVTYDDPFTVRLTGVKALVSDINSPASAGGTIRLTFGWGDGSTRQITIVWPAGSFGVGMTGVTHAYPGYPGSYNIVLIGRSSNGPYCRYTGRADVMGGIFTIGGGGILLGIITLVSVVNIKPKPTRPAWWRPLRPGIPYFQTNRIASMLEVPQPWNPLNLNQRRTVIRRWPTFQMVPGVQSDPWADIKCPFCGHDHMFYTAWGVGCHSQNCINNTAIPQFPVR